MTYVVTDACIRCKYMDCVEVCPVDCFYEGENMLVIHPDECIDCGVCEPECPVDAIKPKIADMEERRARAGKGPMQYGMAAFAIVRDPGRLDRDTPIARIVPWKAGDGSLKLRAPLPGAPKLQRVPLPPPLRLRGDIVKLLMEDRQGDR